MAFPYPYPGPVAYLNNLPINSNYYQPQLYFISGISLGPTTIVTTTVNNDYVVGQTCRLIIPPTFGCRQLNEVQGNVLSIPAPNQVELNINSSKNVDAFTSSSARTKAQILAIGDVNSGQTNTSLSNQQTAVPGAFINISPN